MRKYELTGETSDDEASKNNKIDCKPNFRFISKSLTNGAAFAMEAGKIKYGDWNFMKGHALNDLLSAMERHIKEIRDGYLIDEDCSDRLGLVVNHFDCLASNLNMIYAQIEAGTLRDDRFKVKDIGLEKLSEMLHNHKLRKSQGNS